MSQYAPGLTGPASRSEHRRTGGLILLGLTSGALVSGLSVMGTIAQTVLVLVVGAGLPVLLLFLARPDLALALYLLVLPLVLPWPVVAGLNAGETLTLAIISLGMLSLWGTRPRVGLAMRSLGPVLWPLAGLAVVSVTSLLVNAITDIEEIVSALFKVLAFGLVAILIHVHSDTPEKVTRMLNAALLGAAAVAGYAVLAFVLGWSYDPQYDWNRASGTFEHWNMLGGFMAMLSMPTLALALSSRSLLSRLGFAVAFALEIAALLMSLTLGSILALLLSAVFTLVFLMKVSWPRLVASGLLFLTLLGSVLALNEPLREKILNVDERVVDRLMTYAVGVAMFRDKFWFGFGSEQRLLDELSFGEADFGITIFGASSSIPHNSFLKMGVEKGVFGVVLFTLLMVGALRVLFRRRDAFGPGPPRWLYVGIVAGVIAFLIQNMTNDLVLHARMGIVFFALIVLADRMKPVQAGAAATNADVAR